jgi:hypothetical protein
VAGREVSRTPRQAYFMALVNLPSSSDFIWLHFHEEGVKTNSAGSKYRRFDG